jgi:hypothetical protein
VITLRFKLTHYRVRLANCSEHHKQVFHPHGQCSALSAVDDCIFELNVPLCLSRFKKTVIWRKPGALRLATSAVIIYWAVHIAFAYRPGSVRFHRAMLALDGSEATERPRLDS